MLCERDEVDGKIFEVVTRSYPCTYHNVNFNIYFSFIIVAQIVQWVRTQRETYLNLLRTLNLQEIAWVSRNIFFNTVFRTFFKKIVSNHF